ncbi:tetratricopeptide repeat protein [Actinoplanes sp. RD1]|uniref:tetratricopeptide repeat protein n=1 Tax=Actinoplanes sp. RD1 TaxID=3064538 RepID=UPI002742307C|nr:tetratricopeptide repeat protein [Actinoplanes sp. RD1]
MPDRSASAPMTPFTALPDPARAGSLDGIVERLRLLKLWAGDPSYETIKNRVNAGRPAGERVCKSTVAYCFRPGRRRLDTDLVLAVVEALHGDIGYVTQWRQALRVVGGEAEAVTQVRVGDGLPPEPGELIARADEVRRIRDAARRPGPAAAVCAIEGMAGVGKTHLALHAGHLLAREGVFAQVLVVDLRGFDPDPGRPPVDPAAVLDGFLRRLGMPGQRIPHSLRARTSAYRDLVARTRTLVILDNAAGPDQVRPLLPRAAGSLTLVTSRRHLALRPALQLPLAVLAPHEAVEFVTRATGGVPVGADPGAASRIAHRCGCLPLALSLLVGHIRSTPAWTLTDHADRLDDRHRDRRLENGVELALSLSYHHLAPDHRRLLRLLTLPPGRDIDAYAAAVLAGADRATVAAMLEDLCRHHLLQRESAGRYTFHDLVRTYAVTKALDEDRPADRHAALTRLFDHCLALAATAVSVLYPADLRPLPSVPLAGRPAPDMGSPELARGWLDTERSNLLAVLRFTARGGWPAHTVRLAGALHRYLQSRCGAEVVTAHRHAVRAARQTGDLNGRAQALADLGSACHKLGRYGPAAKHLRQALALFARTGDPSGQARALTGLGVVEHRLCRYDKATGRFARALRLHRQQGDRIGEAQALANLADIDNRLGRCGSAADRFAQALALCRQAGNRDGEAGTLGGLGLAELRLGLVERAGEHLEQSLSLYRRLGHRTGEVIAWDNLGTFHRRLGQFPQAGEHHQRSLSICRDIGYREGEPRALNGLGETASAAGRPGDALLHHSLAAALAAGLGTADQQARAEAGLGRAHRALGDAGLATDHFRDAVTLYSRLGMPEADEVRGALSSSG